MTNLECFKDEIVDFAAGGYQFGVINGKPVRCVDVCYCAKCEFVKAYGSSKRCVEQRKKWLNAEHIEKPKLTKKERMFCELVETGWICRDGKLNLLYLYMCNEPVKDQLNLRWKGNITTCLSSDLFIKVFGVNLSFITWDDEYPWSVEDLLKLEVECDKEKE